MEHVEILTAEQTAIFLNLKNKKAVLHAWKNGNIPGTKINNKYMVSKRQLVEHIEKLSLENYRQPKNYNGSAIERKRQERLARKKCLIK